jgi:GGDEF domain-containing protein
MGGDEFLIILPECGNADVSRPLQRLRSCSVGYEHHTIAVKFSVGWVEWRPGESATEILRRADEALYKQKYTKPRTEAVMQAIRPN